MIRLTRPLVALALAFAACAQPRSDPEPRPVTDRAEPAVRRPAQADPGADPTLEALAGADTLRITAVAPGVRHVYAWDGRGPWAIHVLEVDRAVCRRPIEARKAGPPLTARATTSDLAGGAVAAVNADFFMLPGGTPVGAHVQRGSVLIGPGERPVVALTGSDPWIGRATLGGFAVFRADSMAVVQVNRAPAMLADAPARRYGPPDGLVLLTAWLGPRSPADSGTATARIRRLRGSSGAGTGVVIELDTLGRALELDSTVVGLTGRGAARDWLARRAPGDTIRWSVRLHVPDRDAVAVDEAVGGFPVLVRDGAIAPDTRDGIREEFAERRHPRTAVGIAGDGGRILLVAVDGRQAPYSDGMTLPELAELLRRLGSRHALNLDGGGSTAVVVAGRVVNHPSDREGERAVGNALVVTDGACS